MLMLLEICHFNSISSAADYVQNKRAIMYSAVSFILALGSLFLFAHKTSPYHNGALGAIALIATPVSFGVMLSYWRDLKKPNGARGRIVNDAVWVDDVGPLNGYKPAFSAGIYPISDFASLIKVNKATRHYSGESWSWLVLKHKDGRELTLMRPQVYKHEVHVAVDVIHTITNLPVYQRSMGGLFLNPMNKIEVKPLTELWNEREHHLA